MITNEYFKKISDELLKGEYTTLNKMGIPLKDKNGEWRSTGDILNDLMRRLEVDNEQ